MKEMKVSAVVGLSVTLLAVVTAISFSFATVTYQKEVVSLKKINAEYRQVIEDYKAVLLSIKNSLAKVDIQAP